MHMMLSNVAPHCSLLTTPCNIISQGNGHDEIPENKVQFIIRILGSARSSMLISSR